MFSELISLRVPNYSAYPRSLTVWWKAKYGTENKRSTLSDTLSAKFLHLDELELLTHMSLVSKARSAEGLNLRLP